MSDNVTYQDDAPATPADGVVIAADNIDDVAYQRVKLTLGEDGVAMGDVSGRYPLTVSFGQADEIIKQLKIMNFQLSILTDNMISKEDING
ncbi:MAG: hypothetical protein GY841_16060 [FCB group bacterium]|nr:hypothetical protein [FCB group bacterium]